MSNSTQYFHQTDGIDKNNFKSTDNSKITMKWYILSIYYLFLENFVYLIVSCHFNF